MQIRVFTVTSDKYLWTLRPFVHLFNTFWSELQPVVVVGYRHPSEPLPPNFYFHSISDSNYPQSKWSDGLIQFLNVVDDRIFCLLLDDYWLLRTADHAGIASLADYMLENPDVLKIDLTTDRLHAHGDARDAHDIESWGHYDLIQTTNDVSYQMSLQAALWNRELMLSVLEGGRSPWDIELYLCPPEDMRVLGTRQWPLRYANAINKGKIQRAEINKIPQPHRDLILSWTVKDWHAEVT